MMDDQGRITIGKSPSTPDDFFRGVFNSLDRVNTGGLIFDLQSMIPNVQDLLTRAAIGKEALGDCQ